MHKQGNFIRGTIKYKGIVYFILFLLVAIGIFGLTRINKDEFPTFEIKEGLVVGVYPGASAREVEQQLTKPLEDLLFSFSEVERSTYSYSKDGMCYIYVMLNSPVSKKDEVWSKIKHSLNTAKQTLPPGVLAVAVLDDFSSVSSLLIAVESEDKSYVELKEYVDEMCDCLHEIPELAKTVIYGGQSEEIAVNIDKEKLSAYALDASMLMLDYQTSGLQVSSGSFKTDYSSSPIHLGSNLTGEREVREKIVYSDRQGNVIRLGDIAEVTRRYKEPSSLVEFNGRKAMIVSVEMRPENDIVAFGREVDKVLEEFSSILPTGVKVTKVSDQPKVVGTSVWSFLRDLVISMLVVIFVMLMLFPMRSALIASTGVPVCTAVAIAIMFITGMELNTVTLAALIVVLGMIVDDSIITMDGYMDKLSARRRAAGEDPSGKATLGERVDAACDSARELITPMLLATAAIGLMFFPIRGIITGYLGDFVQSFPWIIAFSLGASLIYAVAVIPSMEVKYISSSKATGNNWFTRGQNHFFNALQNGYEKMLSVCFRHPLLTIGTGVAAVALGILMFLQLNVQMMPMAERDCFAVEIYLEENASLDRTKAVSDSLQHILLADERVKSVTAFVGSGSPRFHATYAPKVPGSNFAQFIVNTGTTKETEEVLREYGTVYEHYFPGAQIRFKQMDYQGVTAPVAVTFKGAGIEQMKPYSDSLKQFMASQSDLMKWVHSDFDEYVTTVEVNLDSDEAARLGVNRSLLSLSLAGAFNGQPLATLWEGNTSIPVNLYSNEVTPDMTYDVLDNQMVATSIPGLSVPLRQVASVSPGWEPEAIPHVGGKQTVTVYADMMMDKSQPEAMKRIEEYVDNVLLPSMPEGMSVEYGGLSGVNDSVIPEILLSFICAVAVLFFFLLFHFKKISIAVLTLVLSLLCLFGAFFGLWIYGLDFGITSVLGLISLVGIIVRNGIIMFEYAEELRFSHGMSVKEAAEEAGKRRMRPIFLTSCTTALGVLPMIISRDALWMPMGIVICFGTMLTIALLVFIMPISYWQIFKKDKAASSGTPVKGTAATVVALLLFSGHASQAQTRPLSLEDCRRMALQNNYLVKNARLDVLSAQAQKGEALAEYFPRVSINAFGFYAFDPMLEIGVKDILGDSNLSHNIDSWVSQVAPMYGINPVYSALKQGYSATVSVIQPVFAGGRIVSGNRLASIGVEAARLKGAVQQRSSLEEVEKNYWQVVSLQEKMKTVSTAGQMLDNLQKDVDAAVSAGLATETDRLQLKLKQNELKSTRSKLRGGIRLAKMNLCNAIDLPYSPYSTTATDSLPFIDSILFADDFGSLQEPSVYWTDEQEIVDSREEKALLDLSVRAKQQEKRMVLGEVLPQVGVGLSYGYGNLSVTDPRFNGAVFATVKIPVTDWGKYSRRLRRYDYQVQKAENEKEYLDNQLLLQVRQLWLDVTVSWDQMQVARESVAAAQAVVNRLSAHYRAGLVPLSELLQAQTSLRQAEDALVDARIAYCTALSGYQRLSPRTAH